MGAKYEQRQLVIPGELIWEGRTRTGENTFRREGNVYASRIGLVNYGKNMVSVIALEAGYNPMVGDMVIGEVVDIELGRWLIDIGASTEAVLSVPDAVDKPFYTDFNMPRVLDVGETLVAKIVDLDRRRTPILSMLGKDLGRVDSGLIINITPSKIPRLIGKKGSMINMILKEAGANVVIGQNGRILIQARTLRQENMVVKTIKKIELEAHTSGLTNRIQAYLNEIKENEI